MTPNAPFKRVNGKYALLLPECFVAWTPHDRSPIVDCHRYSYDFLLSSYLQATL